MDKKEREKLLRKLLLPLIREAIGTLIEKIREWRERRKRKAEG